MFRLLLVSNNSTKKNLTEWQSGGDLCSKNYTTYMTKVFMILIHHNRPSQSFIVQLMCQNLQGFTVRSLWRGCYHFHSGLCCVWEKNWHVNLFCHTAAAVRVCGRKKRTKAQLERNGEKALKLHGTFRLDSGLIVSARAYNMCTWKMERIYPLT